MIASNDLRGTTTMRTGPVVNELAIFDAPLGAGVEMRFVCLPAIADSLVVWFVTKNQGFPRLTHRFPQLQNEIECECA